MLKRYKLRQPVKFILILLIVLIIETFYLRLYLDRIEKIENEVKINETTNRK